MHRYILRLECELKSTSTEPVNREPMGALSGVNVKVVIPQELFVTRHGECFHHKSCGVLKSSRNLPQKLSLCSHCKDMLTSTG